MEYQIELFFGCIYSISQGVVLACGTWYWLRTLWRVRNKKSAAYYPVLFTWFPGALLYVLITNTKIITDEIKPKERPLINFFLLIGGYIYVPGWLLFWQFFLALRLGLVITEPYLVLSFFVAPYLISGFVLYNSTKRRYLVPAVILLFLASLPLPLLFLSQFPFP